MEVSNSIFIFNYFKNVFYVQLIQDTARYLMQIETKNKKTDVTILNIRIYVQTTNRKIRHCVSCGKNSSCKRICIIYVNSSIKSKKHVRYCYTIF